jgi:hypothetical protein
VAGPDLFLGVAFALDLSFPLAVEGEEVSLTGGWRVLGGEGLRLLLGSIEEDMKLKK